ncbi:hypothetical protein AURDEDRAFT_120432 [Auricularia subglabra TFB-10046 SS5]|nr:hypothetical protein AURDEDRAFT_120432 [Auricularia subglabra TFB-10046 SS5]
MPALRTTPAKRLALQRVAVLPRPAPSAAGPQHRRTDVGLQAWELSRILYERGFDIPTATARAVISGSFLPLGLKPDARLLLSPDDLANSAKLSCQRVVEDDIPSAYLKIFVVPPGLRSSLRDALLASAPAAYAAKIDAIVASEHISYVGSSRRGPLARTKDAACSPDACRTLYELAVRWATSTEQVTIQSFVLLASEDSTLHSWAELAFLATVDIHAMLNMVVTSTGVTACLDSGLDGDLWRVNVDPRDAQRWSALHEEAVLTNSALVDRMAATSVWICCGNPAWRAACSIAASWGCTIEDDGLDRRQPYGSVMLIALAGRARSHVLIRCPHPGIVNHLPALAQLVVSMLAVSMNLAGLVSQHGPAVLFPSDDHDRREDPWAADDLRSESMNVADYVSRMFRHMGRMSRQLSCHTDVGRNSWARCAERLGVSVVDAKVELGVLSCVTTEPGCGFSPSIEPFTLDVTPMHLRAHVAELSLMLLPPGVSELEFTVDGRGSFRLRVPSGAYGRTYTWALSASGADLELVEIDASSGHRVYSSTPLWLAFQVLGLQVVALVALEHALDCASISASVADPGLDLALCIYAIFGMPGMKTAQRNSHGWGLGYRAPLDSMRRLIRQKMLDSASISIGAFFHGL